MSTAASSTQPKKRRPRTTKKNHTLLDLPPECHLSKLPVELLSEVLLYTKSPRDVLAVARSCKALCYTLLNEKNQFIWRYCRKNCKPEPLPEPVGRFTESAYAALVFDDANCEVCGDPAPLMSGSYGLRLKLCRKPQCKAGLTDSTKRILTCAPLLPDPLDFATPSNPLDQHKDRPYFSALPTVETDSSFDPLPKSMIGVVSWPQSRAMYRISDLTVALQEYLDESSTTDRFEAYIQHCEVRARQNQEFMRLCVELYKWKFKFETAIKAIKTENEQIGRRIAKAHGLEYWDLVATPSYGEVHRAKNRSIEKIGDIDYNVREDIINTQLLKIKEQRARRTHEEKYRNARNSVQKHYNRLRAGRQEMPLPTLDIFRELPIVVQFQKNAQPNLNLESELQSSIITSMLHTQLEEWRTKAKDHLGTLLGVPVGWKSASTNKLHPAQRVTARFRCGRCTRVEMRYLEDGCLDLAGVCAHVCESPNKKNHRPQWKVENFVTDEKAISAMKKVVALCGVNPEDSSSIATLKGIGPRILCESCDAAIIMTPENVIGHSHRHDDMQMKFLTKEEADDYLKTRSPVKLTQKLLGPDQRAPPVRRMVVYGCRHCVQRKQKVSEPASQKKPGTGVSPASSGTTSVANAPAAGENSTSSEAIESAASDATASGPATNNNGTSPSAAKTVNASGKTKKEQLFSFDGLKSHLIAKHGVHNIRDEDLYCTIPHEDLLKKLQ